MTSEVSRNLSRTVSDRFEGRMCWVSLLSLIERLDLSMRSNTTRWLRLDLMWLNQVAAGNFSRPPLVTRNINYVYRSQKKHLICLIGVFIYGLVWIFPPSLRLDWSRLRWSREISGGNQVCLKKNTSVLSSLTRCWKVILWRGWEAGRFLGARSWAVMLMLTGFNPSAPLITLEHTVSDFIQSI